MSFVHGGVGVWCSEACTEHCTDGWGRVASRELAIVGRQDVRSSCCPVQGVLHVPSTSEYASCTRRRRGGRCVGRSRGGSGRVRSTSCMLHSASRHRQQRPWGAFACPNHLVHSPSLARRTKANIPLASSPHLAGSQASSTLTTSTFRFLCYSLSVGDGIQPSLEVSDERLRLLPSSSPIQYIIPPSIPAP